MRNDRSRLRCLALGLLLCAGSAIAQPTSVWRPIASDKGRSIEVDTAGIQRTPDGKVVATSRLVLEKEIVDVRSGAPYKYIQSVTRYDCAQRVAANLKRSFLRASEEVLREEVQGNPVEMPVHSATLDYRVMREVCRPPEARSQATRSQAVKVADKASAAAAALREANEAVLQKQVKAAAAQARPGRTATIYAGSKPPVNRKAVVVAPAPTRPLVPDVWAYDGPGGPEHWADVHPDYARCRDGRRQSPINVQDGIRVDLEPLAFDYAPSLFTIEDTGHGIEVTLRGNYLSLLGKSYELERVRFHRPAEESLEGRVFPMGVHLEHLAPDGERLVVAVLLNTGAAHPLIQTLWNYLPLEQFMEVSPPAATIDLNMLLPKSRGYHTFMGSLTRPPCDEGVVWVVMQTPVEISPEQEAIFARLYPLNARPLQPGNGRLIKSSR